jgi:hypothetical protein
MTLGALADHYDTLRPKRGAMRILIPALQPYSATALLKDVARGLDGRGGSVSITRNGVSHGWAFSGGDPAVMDKTGCWIWTLTDERAAKGTRKSPVPARRR